MLYLSGVCGRERHNPHPTTPGRTRDPILKWRTRPNPPIDAQRLTAPIRIHPKIRAQGRRYYCKIV
jgi:hypothetical protein